MGDFLIFNFFNDLGIVKPYLVCRLDVHSSSIFFRRILKLNGEGGQCLNFLFLTIYAF